MGTSGGPGRSECVGRTGRDMETEGSELKT